jgi:hypothetical protein
MGKILGEGERQKFGADSSRDRNDSVSSYLEHEPKLPAHLGKEHQLHVDIIYLA